VPDDAVVVGVEAGGKHRAYLLQGMCNPNTHVVNDLLGGVPLSVAFCNLRDCVTTYTPACERNEPFEIGVYGLIKGQIVLSADGRAYFQEPSQASEYAEQPDRLPFLSYPFEQISWGAWPTEHPDTDIYLGDWYPGR